MPNTTPPPKRSDLLNSGWIPAQQSIASAVTAGEVQHTIEEALKQSRDFDGSRISVSVANGTVTLAGNVATWIEREEALNVGWCAPGVVKVLDRITIKR